MKKYMLLLILFMFILNLPVIYCSAETSEAIPKEISFVLQENVIDKRFLEIEMVEKENKSYEIQCFDVSETGNVAVGMSDDIVNIYDVNNNFMCGYEINSRGVYALKWENDNLYIYFLRYNTAVLLSMQGNILNTYTIKEDENYNDMYDYAVRRNKSEKNGFIYELKCDFFLGGANRLLKHSDDSQTVILDTSNIMKKKLATTVYIFPIAVFSVAVIIILLHKSKYRNLLFKHYK